MAGHGRRITQAAGWHTVTVTSTHLNDLPCPAGCRITRLLAGIKYSSFLKARLHKALGCSLVLLGPVMKLLPLVHYR